MSVFVCSPREITTVFQLILRELEGGAKVYEFIIKCS